MLAGFLDGTVDSLAVEAVYEDLLVGGDQSDQVHGRAVSDESRVHGMVESLFTQDLQSLRLCHVDGTIARTGVEFRGRKQHRFFSDEAKGMMMVHGRVSGKEPTGRDASGGVRVF